MRALSWLPLLLLAACGPSTDKAPVTPPLPVTMASAPLAAPTAPLPKKRVIVFVWDGLRPDSVNAEDTPRLARLAAEGVTFTDHHSTFPSFTMVNAATLSSGGLADTTGYASNWVWLPDAVRRSPDGKPVVDARGTPQKYEQPLFTEDFTGLRDLDEYFGGELVMVGTLFEAARKRGLTTVAIGKSGPAYLQDRHRQGNVFDEKGVWPVELVKELQQKGVKLPRATAEAYPEGTVTLDGDNGDPTLISPSRKLPDGKTPESHGDANVLGNPATAYLMDVYRKHLLAGTEPGPDRPLETETRKFEAGLRTGGPPSGTGPFPSLKRNLGGSWNPQNRGGWGKNNPRGGGLF